MKICSPQLGLAINSVLGGEVHDHFVIQGLANKGHKIFVYLPKDRSYQKNNNVIVSRAPIKHIPAITFNLFIIPYLFSQYKKEKFEILRVHNPYFVGIGALLFKFFHPEVKIVATHHLSEDSFFFNLINKLTVSKYDVIIAVSNHLKNWLIESFKINQSKVHVIYNGVDPMLKPMPKSQILIKEFNLKGKFVFLFIGLLIRRKNPIFLLQIFKELRKKDKDVALIICGRGPLKEQIKKFINANSLSNVHMLDEAFNEKKVSVFNLCDVFTLPSQKEGFGLVVAEAMACGKPVIASANSSLPEIVKSGENGYLLEGDPQEWASKLLMLKKNNRLRTKLGKNAAEKAHIDFDWSKAITRHENVYKNLIKPKPTRPNPTS